MMTKKEIKLRQRADEPGVAYIELHDHPHSLTKGLCKKTIAIHRLIENYSWPQLNLDFNAEGLPVGIEIIYDEPDEDFEEIE